MEVRLTPEQEAFVQQGIKNGRYRTPEDAIQEALCSWEEHQRNRTEILVAVDESEADVQAGRYRDYTDDTLSQLAQELKNEGRTARETLRHR